MKFIIIPFMVILLSACVGENYDKNVVNPNCLKPEDFPACPNNAVRTFEYSSATRIKRCVWKTNCEDRQGTFRLYQ